MACGHLESSPRRRRGESSSVLLPHGHAAAAPPFKHAGANEMTNPFPVPHKKEWADLGPYRAQVNAATRAQEAAMAKKGRKGGKPKLFARSTDLSRDRRAQKRAAGKRSSRVGLREPELRSVLSGAGDEELLEATLSKYSVADDAEEGNAVMAQWRDDRFPAARFCALRSRDKSVDRAKSLGLPPFLPFFAMAAS